MTNKLLALLACFTLSFGAYAQVTQKEFKGEQVLIDADSQIANIKENITIFENNVSIVHGLRKITADRLEAHRRAELGEDKQLLIATGNPASYEETMEDGTVIKAQANEIRYDVATDMLKISGNAKISMADQNITAQTITYDLEKQLISAEKDKDSSTRVRTTLTPTEQKKSSKSNNQQEQ